MARKKKVKVKAQEEEEEEEEEIESSADEEEAEAEADIDELAELRSELEETKAQATEYLDGWQRAQAEFANYRKRQEAEWAQMRARATADVLQKILPAVDDFERALSASPNDVGQSTWREGITMIKAKLDAILESEGVTSIETAGQPFDPTYHEAVTYEEADGFEEGQIIGEVQKGYMLGERILRPALVRVAKASFSPLEENGNADEDKEE